jgi:predicted MFS family arabinose efflux permease
VIAPALITEFDLPSSVLGGITAAFFIGFAAVQIPLGFLLDRFGPRATEAGLFLIAMIGAAVFATANGVAGLTLGRALIGVGMAGGLMAALKALVQWFPSRHLGLVNGLFLGCGGLGALAATTPLAWTVERIGWRGAFWIFAVLLAVVAAWIWLSVPQRSDDRSAAPLREQLAEFVGILRDGLFWRLAPASMTGMGGVLTLQTLWAGPWLIDVAGLSVEAAAIRLLVLACGVTLGFLTIGALADWLGRRGFSPLHLIAASGLAYGAALLVLVLRVDPGGFAAWGLLGFFGNASALVYPLQARYFGAALAGRANTANSLLVFGGVFIEQWAIGAVIGLWPRDAAGHYPPEAYSWALGALLVLVAVSLLPLIRVPKGVGARISPPETR